MQILKILRKLLTIALIILLLQNCNFQKNVTNEEPLEKGTFGYDLEFLCKHQQTVILERDGAMLAICPAYQGRVMTSSSGGKKGLSYGWLNYELIESGEVLDHINPVGGEDRFWLGPEGGQFSIFFKDGDEFDLDDWQTPPSIDTEAYDIVGRDKHAISFRKEISLQNYSGFRFDLRVDRSISILDTDRLKSLLNTDLSDDLDVVAFESENVITNIGDRAWEKKTGALSIWILGMFNPSPTMTIIVPFNRGEESTMGPIVNDNYFGKVPEERLAIDDGILYFKGDGKYRSKIGLSPKRAKPIIGSYDAALQVLTIVTFTKSGEVDEYVNSMWEIQESPFAGDAVNSYNDGPVDGSALGPFYELETSSHAAFLSPGASLQHVHSTIHIQGNEKELDEITKELFGVNIQTIKNIFS